MPSLPRPHNNNNFKRTLKNINTRKSYIPGERAQNNLAWAIPKLQFTPAVTRRFMPTNANLAGLNAENRKRYTNRARKGERSPNRAPQGSPKTPNRPRLRIRIPSSKVKRKP